MVVWVVVLEPAGGVAADDEVVADAERRGRHGAEAVELAGLHTAR